MSITQADRVETLLRTHDVRLNEPWGGLAAIAEPASLPVVLANGMQITMLSPTTRELAPLARKWQEFRTQQRGGSFEDEHDDSQAPDANQDVQAPNALESDERPLYIAHAHADVPWRDRLLRAVGPRLGTAAWSASSDSAGTRLQRERFRETIERTGVAVVLLSPAALESPFLMQEELPALVKEAERGGLILTWLVLEKCRYERAQLSAYQSLRDPDAPLEALPDDAADRTLSEIAGRLVGLVTDVTSAAPPQAPRRPRGGDDGPIDVEALVGRPYVSDRSVANNASLAFLAEVHGKALLVCGDASAEVLAASIRAVLERRRRSRLRVDAFVVPHNGSARNLTKELLELLDCDRYLISTDGSTFRHPDRETIARILAFGRGSPNTPLTLVFNYRTQWTTVWDDPALKARWNYQAIYPTGEGGGIKVQI